MAFSAQLASRESNATLLGVVASACTNHRSAVGMSLRLYASSPSLRKRSACCAAGDGGASGGGGGGGGGEVGMAIGVAEPVSTAAFDVDGEVAATLGGKALGGRATAAATGGAFGELSSARSAAADVGGGRSSKAVLRAAS